LRAKHFALMMLVAQSTLVSVELWESHVRYDRREKTGGQQASLSAPKAAEQSTMPFGPAAHLHD